MFRFARITDTIVDRGGVRLFIEFLSEIVWVSIDVFIGIIEAALMEKAVGVDRLVVVVVRLRLMVAVMT